MMDGTDRPVSESSLPPISPNQPLEYNQGLRLPCPEKFDGSEEKFEDFAYSLRSYLSMSSPAFYDIMKSIEDGNSMYPIDFNTLDHAQKSLAATLQNSLIALCRGASAKIIRRDQSGLNGFESWRLLWERYRPSRIAKATSRISNIIYWKFNQKDFLNSFNE